MRIKPTIYIPKSPDNDLIEVLIEEYADFDILWYHWPKDGDGLKYAMVKEEDYEPVIVFYDNDSICMIYTRRHWGYQDYNLDEGLVIPPEIYFKDEDHPPYVKKQDDSEQFSDIIKNLEMRSYTPTKISSDKIAQKFRTGKQHRANPTPLPVSLRPSIVDDPFDKATKCFEKYLNRKNKM